MITEAHKELIKNLIQEIGNDGHSIWDPAVLEGFPPEFRQRYEKIHQSGDTYKETIFIENGIAQYLEGVYGLDVLEDLCRILKLDYHRARGRGFRARACTEALSNWCNNTVAV